MAEQKKPDAEDAPDAPESLLLTLPPELLVDGIIPHLATRDILSLSRTNKLLHSLCKDPSVWRTKLESDFTFFAPQVALGSGGDSGWYERVYLGLQQPRTYLWGSAEQSRLGSASDVAARSRAPRLGYVRKVTAPMDVSDWFADAAPDGHHASVIDLQAAGWSFAARDSAGGVWVWGKLNGGTWQGDHDWSHAGTIVDDAARIPLPCAATAIATGRQHLVVLDADNLIWEMTAWGRAYHHTARALTAPAHSGAGDGSRPHVVQVDAGWEFSAALTADGEIHTWKPFEEAYNSSLTPEEQLNGPLGTVKHRKLCWGTVGPNVVFTLPSLPERPEPPSYDKDLVAAEDAFLRAEEEQGVGRMSDAQKEARLRVVKIAATNNSVLALRANGEVWAGSSDGAWEYLAHFSSPAITHISAQWTNFFTYATSTRTNPTSAVYAGNRDAFPPGAGWDTRATPLPGLEGLRIVRVVAGDWHYAALTADGAMYTWGQDEWGQCGLGRPEDEEVQTPTRVTFPPDGEREAFVFGITAAGMHTGALVLGHPRGKDELPPILKREPDHDLDNEEAGEEDFDPAAPGARMLPFLSMPRFRIGFAGRGGRRGGSSRGRGAPPGPM